MSACAGINDRGNFGAVRSKSSKLTKSRVISPLIERLEITELEKYFITISNGHHNVCRNFRTSRKGQKSNVELHVNIG